MTPDIEVAEVEEEYRAAWPLSLMLILPESWGLKIWRSGL